MTNTDLRTDLRTPPRLFLLTVTFAAAASCTGVASM